MNERVKLVKVVKVAKEAKVVKVAKEAKVVKVFQNIPGSQLLSDIQTFFFKPPGPTPWCLNSSIALGTHSTPNSHPFVSELL